MPAAHRFAAGTQAVARRLPLGHGRTVPATLIGFAAINTGTFAVDLACLGVTRSVLHWPLPLAVTTGYVVAFALGFALNRVLNFRSHGAVGQQLGLYVITVVVNYLVWVLAVVEVLARAGVFYLAARVIGATCEAAFVYLALRFVVFRGTRDRPENPGATIAATPYADADGS